MVNKYINYAPLEAEIFEIDLYFKKLQQHQ